MTGVGVLRHSLCLQGSRLADPHTASNEQQMMMSETSAQENESSRPRDSRRRELRDLLVAAADGARRRRQSAMGATLSRAVPQAVRERVARFLATTR